MNVLIVAEYLDNIENPDVYNSRFLTVADQLVARGHTIQIVTTDFIHSLKQHVSGVTSYNNCKLTALHEPGYLKNVCLKRFYSHWVLSRNLKKWLKNIDKPDVIYCAVPSLDFANQAARYAKKNGVKFVLDIQDLWPEAFEMVLPIPILPKLLFLPLRMRANKIYRAADYILAVSQTYVDRALCVNKTLKQSAVVFLGTKLERFDSYRSIKPAIEKSPDEICLSYVGTLGHSYDLKTVMDALDILKTKPYYNKIRLVVVGDGPLRSSFEEYAALKQVSVQFTGMLPYSQMVATLCVCDIAINPIVKGARASIINKHGDYAASGIPVVNSQECAEYRKLVDDWNMGFNVECENPIDMAEKIAFLVEDKELRAEKGNGSRACAEAKFDRAHSYSQIINAIEQ